MSSVRLIRTVVAPVIACLLGLTLWTPAAIAAPAASAASASAASAPSAPSNLRVTGLTSTSVMFQWDPSGPATLGCTVPIVLYAVFVDGRLRGWTYLGSPVAFVGGLRPGTTYVFTVQGRDNCSGALSPMSAPLRVTTPR
jgi:chitinase